MTTLLEKCACPDGTLRARFLGWQGGGLYIQGTATTLTNTNVYSNSANSVRACTLELTLAQTLSTSAPPEVLTLF